MIQERGYHFREESKVICVGGLGPSTPSTEGMPGMDAAGTISADTIGLVAAIGDATWHQNLLSVLEGHALVF